MMGEREVNDLIAAVSVMDDCPFPIWVKDLGGEVVSCNAAFECQYLNGEDVASQAFSAERWGQSLARDREVIESRLWNLWRDEDGMVVKWPVLSRGDVVGVVGILLPKETLNEMLGLLGQVGVDHGLDRFSLRVG